MEEGQPGRNSSTSNSSEREAALEGEGDDDDEEEAPAESSMPPPLSTAPTPAATEEEEEAEVAIEVFKGSCSCRSNGSYERERTKTSRNKKKQSEQAEVLGRERSVQKRKTSRCTPLTQIEHAIFPQHSTMIIQMGNITKRPESPAVQHQSARNENQLTAEYLKCLYALSAFNRQKAFSFFLSCFCSFPLRARTEGRTS